ncbi:hypothetical protein MFLAVUS_008332 [Mucor flavus]|uniref:Uncharacterized protein n=1 Tax=Mucor flavus TaxID=439312 RepID=A0ABP9Z6Y2_9FUNG
MEAMYQYQLEMVEKQVEYERLQILEDINQKTNFARRISKLQAISDRQRASKKSSEDAFDTSNQEDLDLDMFMIKKSICGD